MTCSMVDWFWNGVTIQKKTKLTKNKIDCKMSKNDIIDFLVFTAFSLEKMSGASSFYSEMCIAAAILIESGNFQAMQMEAKFQRETARKIFRNQARNGAMTWWIFEARVRAFCAYMLCLALPYPHGHLNFG